MTKSELVNYLRSYSKAHDAYYSYYHDVENLKKRIRYLKSPPPKPSPSTIGHSNLVQAGCILVWGIFYLIPTYICGILLTELISCPEWLLLLPFIIPATVLTWIVYRLFLNKVLSKKYSVILQKHQEARLQLPALEKQLQVKLPLLRINEKNFREIESQCILPAAYCTGYYAKTFLGYLENGRADTLKEAINLSELEDHQDAMRQEAQRHNREMERYQAQQAEAAAAAQAEAERSAEIQEQTRKDVNFWGLMNVFGLDDLRKDK